MGYIFRKFYFYENALESHGQHRRWKWHYCPCCPTNIARLIASLGSYFYSTRSDAVAVHLYGANTAEIDVGGRPLKVQQVTRYPWDGDVALTLSPAEPFRFTLRLRIPGWCPGATVSVNGEPVDIAAHIDGGYVSIEREWQAGDTVRLAFEMPVDRLYANPAVGEDAGRVALKRGPIVYCMEEADIGFAPQGLRLPADAAITAAFEPDLLGGAVTLSGDALRASGEGWDHTLYRTEPPRCDAASFKAIPYHLWANRAPGAMLVWIPEAGGVG